MSATRRRPDVSVLIPTLDEAGTLPSLLADLAAQEDLALEIIVADGGSRDGTPTMAAAQGARCIAARRGRGAQLNAAARTARAPWLVCLHADSRVSDRHQLAAALAQMRDARGAQPLVAGHWALRFRRETSGWALLFRQLEAKSASNRAGTVNGDQGCFLHRETLAALGGFDESLPFFEDHRLAAQIHARGRWLLLPGLIETSARRFESEGHAARLALMALMVGAEAAGLEDWLASLPALYRAQAQTSTLGLAPFLASLSATLRTLPPSRQPAVRAGVGRLLTGNAWQLALLLEQASSTPNPQWLRRFDRHLAASLERGPWPGLAGRAMLAAIHFAARRSKQA